MTRRGLVEAFGNLSIYVKVDKDLKGLSDSDPMPKYKGSFDYYGTQQIRTHFNRPGVYPSHSLVDILNDKVDVARFKGKVLYIGRVRADKGVRILKPLIQKRLWQ